jgi:hypothetical protein
MATTAARSRFCLRERGLRGLGLLDLRDMRLNGTLVGDEAPTRVEVKRRLPARPRFPLFSLEDR